MDEIKKKLSKIYTKEPSNKISIIHDYERAHRLWMVNNFGPFVKYFEDSYDFYLDLVYSLNYVPKKGWAWKKNLQYLYFGTATRSLFKAFTVLLDGFYDDSISIARTAYELFVKIIFCSCYPNDVWCTYAKAPKGQRQFNLTNFLKHDLKVDWDFLYELTSGASHGKLYLTRILSNMRANRGGNEPIGLWLKIDQKLISIPVNQLTFLIWGYIRLLTVIFPIVYPDGERNQTLMRKSKDFDDALGTIVKTMPNKMKQVGLDFEKVIKIVQIAEAGGSWKKD